MAFVKLVKNKAYFKRFQVKYRRRREGKTDYYARKRLVAQDKNKYNSPKYRFVVRFSNKDITCQVVSSKIAGDVCHAAAYAHELTRYGMPVGHTNYACAYATGLLCARRLLSKYGLDKQFPGTVEIDGEFEDDYVMNAEDEDGVSAFHALLDVGLKATTVGSRLFGALKGAFDGGLEIPHSNKSFYGYDKDNKEYDAGEHRDHIFGAHVGAWLEEMKAEAPEEYTREWSKYIEHGLESAEDIEEAFEKCHAAIRADPIQKITTKKKPEITTDLLALKRDVVFTDADGNTKYVCRNKRSKQQRDNRVAQKKAHVLAQIAAEDEDEDSDE